MTAPANQEPLSSWSFVENLKRYAREAGIGKFNLHRTRHTFARMVVERTGSLSETQEALGHRHMATTRSNSRLARKRLKIVELAKRVSALERRTL
jgi:site-specific recombinase XerD